MKTTLRKIFAVCSVFYCLGLNAQMNNWIVPPYSLGLNNGGTPTTATVSGMGSASNACNAAFDGSGNLMFYVLSTSIFDPAGIQVGSLSNLLYKKSSGVPEIWCTGTRFETAIVPIPGECKKFYVIYNTLGARMTGSNPPPQWNGALLYSIVDCSSSSIVVQACSTSAPGSTVCYNADYAGIHNNNFVVEPEASTVSWSAGIAVSRMYNGVRYLYLAGNNQLRRYTISSTGIGSGVQIATAQTTPTASLPWANLDFDCSELELSADGTTLVWGTVNSTKVFKVTLTNNTSTTISTVEQFPTFGVAPPTGFNKIFGCEIQNSANKEVYVTAQGGLFKCHSGITSVSSTTNYTLSQIELAKDGYMYLYDDNGRLSNFLPPASGTPTLSQFGTAPLNANGFCTSIPEQYNFMVTFAPKYLLPDQIDGENYNWQFTTPSVSITQNGNLCVGSSLLLTSNVTPSGVPVSYVWSTGATTSSLSVSNGGTYTVTVTSENGCTASATTSVTQRPKPILNPITSEPGIRCTQQGNLALSATAATGNTATFSSYLWSSSPVTSVHGAITSSVTATPQTVTTVYTVTVTSNFGCTTTQSATISWDPSCCVGSTITCGGNTVGLTYGDVRASTIWNAVCGTTLGGTRIIDISGLGADRRIAINGTLTIDGDYTFRNCTYTNTNPNVSGGITFSRFAKVLVPNTRRLTIENSYFFACGTFQWVGIQVENGGTLITQSNANTLAGGIPVIADATVAINGINNAIGVIDLNNTRFYRNWVGVNIPSSATTYTGSINGCTFSYNATDPLQNYMLLPNPGKRTAVAIFANNMSGWFWNINNIGEAANTFTEINNGIYAYRSNIMVNNNIFNRIWNYDAVNPSSGNAVYAISLTGSQNSIWVETNSTAGIPGFNNCRCAVFLNNVHALVQDNYMLDDTMGIFATACTNTDLDFTLNTITNTCGGITFNDVNSSIVRKVRALDNSITVREPFLATAPNTSHPSTYGIAHLEASNATVTCADGSRECRVLIENNNITDGRYGVFVNNAYGTRVTYNNIYQGNFSSTSGFKAGIFISNGNDPLITQNDLYGNGVTYEETGIGNSAYRRNGIYIASTQSSELCNNAFHNIGYGMHFQGNCTGTELIRNTINATRYGIVVKHNGVTPTVIGEQGKVNLSHGNSFVGPFTNTGNFRTYAFNTDARFQPFRIFNHTNPATQPFPNGSDVSTWEIVKGASSSSNEWECSTLPGGYKSAVITQGDLYTKTVAEGNGDELVTQGFEESAEWMLEKDLFMRLKDNNLLKQSKPVFQDFYEEKEQTSIGDISRYEDALKTLSDTTIVKDSVGLDAQIEILLAVNNQMQANTPFEQNRKWVNELYLNTLAKGNIVFSQIEKQDLYNLASKCPFEAGDAVYVARTLYNLIDNNEYFDDNANCENAVFKKEQAAKEKVKKSFAVSLIPNPASSSVEISITGETEELELLIYNSLGELVGTNTFVSVAEVDTDAMGNGVYQVCIKKQNQLIHTARLVIAK